MTIHTTKIYLVTNCFGDPNKVYIGKTIKSRKAAHKRTYGDQIEYTYIDEIQSPNRKDWKNLETYWIQQFQVWGFQIMNKRKTGGGGLEFCPEPVKDKMRKARLGKKFDEQWVQNMKTARWGGNNKENFGNKVREARLGMKFDEQWIQNMKTARWGNKSKRKKDQVYTVFILIFILYENETHKRTKKPIATHSKKNDSKN